MRAQHDLQPRLPYAIMFENPSAGDSKMNFKEAAGYFSQLRDLHRFKREHPAERQTYRRVTADELRRKPRVTD